MKKILPLLVVTCFVLSGLGAVAVSVEKENIVVEENDRDYTHTVLVEVGTASWCPSCPASNTAWHNIYGSGDYDFEYCEMVVDKNTKANQRMNQYSLYWVPTSYFDGGYKVHDGTNYNTFYNNLDASGARSVPDLEATLEVEWLGDAQLDIAYIIENNDNDDYPGRLRVYVIELESTLWNDNSGNPYYHAYLDSVWDKNIDIDSGDSLEDDTVWDGAAAGYPNIDADNLQVILAIFDDQAHTAYSDPPSGAPFNAYYVDECVAAIPGQNEPPNPPTISGPTTEDPGVEIQYTFTLTDPDEDDMYLWIDWGDGLTDGWLGTYENGEEVIVSHTYDEPGFYDITAQGRDVNYNVGEWSEPYTVAIGNMAPEKPTIQGPTSGKVKTSYDYTFSTTDPNIDQVYYYIKWGDGNNVEWDGPYISGQEITLSHSWKDEGNWIIEAKAKDPDGAESSWARLSVQMPRTRTISIINYLQNYPIIYQLIQRLLNL